MSAPTPSVDPRPFDLLGPLPDAGTTTVLEASAGTGKTYTLAGLVTRYVAEGVARLDEMLLITFGRAASQELRERVRGQLRDALAALERPAPEQEHALLTHLRGLDADPADPGGCRRRLRDALAHFDAATIATTHQFCQLVLRSLGVAGDSEAGVTLVESLDDLLTEVVDDLYLARFGGEQGRPPFDRAEALRLARDVTGNPGVRLTPLAPTPGGADAVRLGFAHDVLAELERRKRRRGVLGFDDLLSRLAAALADPDAPARDRLRGRWRIVMVDEFQDTDPVQWRVVRDAFVGHATVVLIGDPKQAIYAFRGGDITTYLAAARDADRATLGRNHRSDAALVAALQVLLGGAALGHDDIVVRPVEAAQQERRLQGAPHDDPVRLRVVTRDQFGQDGDRHVPMDRVRDFVARDLAADVAALLASGATFEGRPVRAGDVAVIVEKHLDARACRDALAAAGVPAVYTGDSDVFASPAAADWLRLLEAFDQPHRSGLVRAAAVTRFLGHDADALAAGGDALTDDVAALLRRWADHARARGVAAVLEVAWESGMGERVLATSTGERDLTDLVHLGELLHRQAHRERLGLPALLGWLRQQCEDRAGAPERNRRLDSDAAAVQVMTVWVSKGQQYPVVYLPFAFNRSVPDTTTVLYHDGDQRCLDLADDHRSAEGRRVAALGRTERAGDDVRLAYVALTRAQSQVVAWWAPSWDERNGGLSRLLRGREPGAATVPEALGGLPDDHAAVALFRRWEERGGLRVERAEVGPAVAVPAPAAPSGLGVRRFTRTLDLAWRRTSYSALVRAAEEAAAGVASEPEQVPLDDETELLEVAAASGEEAGHDLVSPMAALPAGAGFGSLVHAVLEEADPQAPDLEAELARHAREQLVWWPVEASADDLAAALLPMHDTPLGPLAGDLTLRAIGRRDRLRELDFEIPLAGGDAPLAGPAPVLADVGHLLRRHLPDADPLAPYAERLLGPALGEQPLRGYLSGSIDVVLRVPGPGGPGGPGQRFVVVDYKTNRLGEPDRPVTAADYLPSRLGAAMLHSDYPLQALLYTAVLHRYLRWRLPGYRPEEHLGGVLYLYVRGMCGPTTPVNDGVPAGVFSWLPPAALVTDLSDLLDARAPRTEAPR